MFGEPTRLPSAQGLIEGGGAVFAVLRLSVCLKPSPAISGQLSSQRMMRRHQVKVRSFRLCRSPVCTRCSFLSGEQLVSDICACQLGAEKPAVHSVLLSVPADTPIYYAGSCQRIRPAYRSICSNMRTSMRSTPRTNARCAVRSCWVFRCSSVRVFHMRMRCEMCINWRCSAGRRAILSNCNTGNTRAHHA